MAQSSCPGKTICPSLWLRWVLLVARNRLSLLTFSNGRQESDQQAGSQGQPQDQASEGWNAVSELPCAGSPWPSCLLKPGLWDGEEALRLHLLLLQPLHCEETCSVPPLRPPHCIPPRRTVHMEQLGSAQPSQPGKTALTTWMQRRCSFFTFSEAHRISFRSPTSQGHGDKHIQPHPGESV